MYFILLPFYGRLLAIIALIINYVKRSDVQGSIFASHFTWQIRTFWWYLAWNIIAFCRLFSCSSRVKIPIYLQVLLSHRLCSVWVLSAAWIWIVYRAIHLIALNDNRPMYQ